MSVPIAALPVGHQETGSVTRDCGHRVPQCSAVLRVTRLSNCASSPPVSAKTDEWSRPTAPRLFSGAGHWHWQLHVISTVVKLSGLEGRVKTKRAVGPCAALGKEVVTGT